VTLTPHHETLTYNKNKKNLIFTFLIIKIRGLSTGFDRSGKHPVQHIRFDTSGSIHQKSRLPKPEVPTRIETGSNERNVKKGNKREYGTKVCRQLIQWATNCSKSSTGSRSCKSKSDWTTNTTTDFTKWTASHVCTGTTPIT